MKKNIVLALILIFAVFIIFSLYSASKWQVVLRPIAPSINAKYPTLYEDLGVFGQNAFALMGTRMAGMQVAAIDFGFTYAQALKDTADQVQARVCETLWRHKDDSAMEKIIVKTKDSARTLASMCIVAGGMNNLARNTLAHPLAKVWGSNSTKHTLKVAAGSPDAIGLEEELSAKSFFSLQKLKKMGIPVGAVLDGTIAAAAAYGLTRSGVLPLATLFTQTGLAGTCGSSFMVKAFKMQEAPQLFAPFTCLGISFSTMAIIGGVQIMVDNCPEIKKLRSSPAAFRQLTQELMASESKELYFTFLKRVVSQAARTSRSPLAFIGGAGVVMCNTFNICDGLTDIVNLVVMHKKD